MEYRTVINKIVFTSPEAMVEFSGGNICLKGQGIFSLDVNKIIQLQVMLQRRYAKNVIRYAFMLKGSQSHVFA